MSHTPGPWTAFELPDDSFAVCQNGDMPPGGDCIAYVNAVPGHNTAANVRLVEAAPDLLAACEAALGLEAYMHENEYDGHASGMILGLWRAVKKAKGDR